MLVSDIRGQQQKLESLELIGEPEYSRVLLKAIESAFQSKLNINSSTSERKSAPSNQEEEDSSGGGGQGRGRGRNQRGRGRGNYGRNLGNYDSSPRCNVCNKIGHFENDCWHKGKPQCYHCNKFGHLQKDCRLKNTQQANYTEENETQEKNERTFFACQHVSEKKEDIWFIDSGCTNHMTPEKEIFHDLDTSFTSKVKMGNGELAEVKGKDNIQVETEKGKEFIYDVLFVPGLDQSLLSVGQLVEHGYSVNFKDNSCIIYDKGREKMVVSQVRMTQHRSFPLTLKYAQNMALKASVLNESWLWHKRFGHLNFQSLKLLYYKNIVHGLPTIEDRDGTCEGCALGKHHRQSFPKGVAWRAKKVLEFVHTDVCGPMQTLSHTQNRYFILFIDDYSRMTWLQQVTNKPTGTCYLKKV